MSLDSPARDSKALKLVIGLAVALFALRLFLSGALGLGDDEAYYWDWSRRLQLSYYDHPAMTAWLIKLGTLVFGQTSFGVRFFGQLSNAFSGLALWWIAERMFNRTVAVIAVLFYLTAPIFSLGGLLMVPDAPMGAAWMLLTAIVWRLFSSNDRPWKLWIAAGFVLGFGFLSKYTILLLVVSIVILFLSERETRREFARPRFWVTALIAAACCAPILIWNAHYDWPTVKYHLHDRQTGGGGANFTRWGQWWASQALILSPVLFLICMGVWVTAVKRWRDRRWRFMLVMSVPVFVMFGAQALFAEFKPHWPAPAYILLFIGAAQLFREGFGFSSEVRRRWARAGFAGGILILIVPLNILFDVGAVWPVVPKLARALAPRLQWDPKYDPTNDLYGWDAVARHLSDLRAARVAAGLSSPFYSSSRYQLTSQLAFATQERVWRVVPDKDQYKFWQTPEEQAPMLGRDSYFVTDQRFERDPRNDHVFNACEELAPFDFYRGDELARRFHVWFCQGYLGTRVE